MPFEKLLTYSSRAARHGISIALLSILLEKERANPEAHPSIFLALSFSTDPHGQTMQTEVTLKPSTGKVSSRGVDPKVSSPPPSLPSPGRRAAPQTIDGEKQKVEQAKFPPIKLSSLRKSGRARVVSVVFLTGRAPSTVGVDSGASRSIEREVWTRPLTPYKLLWKVYLSLVTQLYVVCAKTCIFFGYFHRLPSYIFLS